MTGSTKLRKEVEMFVDEEDVRGDKMRAHICVIGGGASGITLALELAGRTNDVLLLEGGGLRPVANGRNVYRVVPGRELSLGYDEERPFFFGGNTNHWFGNNRPFDAEQFERREWIPYSGWPIRAEDLYPYYVRAQRVAGLGEWKWYDYETCSAYLQHREVCAQSTVLQTRMMHSSPVLSFAELHREALATATDVRVMTGRHVVRLETDRRGERVTRVETVGLDGQRVAVEADIVIVASGGVENARLLLNSKSVVREGLGNEHDLVGRFFMEHWYWDLDLGGMHHEDVCLYEAETAREGAWERLEMVGDASVWAELILAHEVAAAERVPGLAVWFQRTPREYASIAAAKNVVRSLGKSRSRNEVLSDIRVAAGNPRPVGRYVLNRLAGRAAPRDVGHVLRVQIEQTPDPENRIRLSRRRDRFGEPEAELTLRLSPQEQQDHLRSLGIAAEELGVGGSRLPEQMKAKMDAGQSGFFFHHMGTTRMSADPTQGVVDANCRVHGVANLFVAGSSVFPTGGNAPPTLTAVALAIRLADHIVTHES